MASVYIYKYNNYFNRIAKQEDSLSDYSSFLIYEEAKTNFNPNDGVNTAYVGGRLNNRYDGSGDYLIYSEDNINITSRWFIIEQKKLRESQYQLTLKRDVIVDYYKSVIGSPCFINKATVPSGDPAIFNKEMMGVNQIKTSETLLKDEYKTNWLIGYYTPTEETPNIKGESHTVTPAMIYKQYDKLSDFTDKFPLLSKYYNETMTTLKIAICLTKPNAEVGTGHYQNRRFSFNYLNGKLQTMSTSDSTSSSIAWWNYLNKNYPSDTEVLQAYKTIASTVYNYQQAYYYEAYGSKSGILEFDNKIIQVGGKFYKVIVKKYDATLTGTLSTGNIYNEIDTMCVSTLGASKSNSTTTIDSLTYSMKTRSYNYILEEVVNASVTLNVNKAQLTDQPWQMFAIPYQSEAYFKYGDEYYISNQLISLDIATDLARINTVVKDVQILPYTINNGYFSYTTYNDKPVLVLNGKEGYNYDLIKDNEGNILSFVWYPTESSFRNTITLDEAIEITEPKIQNECDLYRFVGPNYSGGFDFNVAKNGGLYQVEINCTYLPYNPYIHINPTFNGLYGSDFNDARGLICSGSFSISTVSDAWANYQITNSTYQQNFDREIQNMDVNRKYEKINQTVGAITGTVTGAVSGTYAGGLVGGVAGGVVGGIAGGIASAAGGIADLYTSDKLYDESKSFKTDMYNLSLQNIKAQPNSISNSTAYNVDNKYFPFIEYYTCTDKEKQALRDQIKYTGMTLNRTGYIKDYLQDDYSYIQGKLIRLEGIEGDNNLAIALANEINQGVYIK